MANVKSGIKATKRTSKSKIKKGDHQTKTSLRSFQSAIETDSTDNIDDTDNIDESAIETDSTDNIDDTDNIDEPGIVKKRATNNMVYLTPDEKVKFLLQNGHKLKDQFDIKSLDKQGNTKQNKPESRCAAECELPSPMKTKSGRLKSSKYKYLEIMDNILKSEFGMISGIHHENSNRTKYSRSGTNNNNNNDIIFNQNNVIGDDESIKSIKDEINKKHGNKTDLTKNKKTKSHDKNNKFTDNNQETFNTVIPVDFSSATTVEGLESENVEDKEISRKSQTEFDAESMILLSRDKGKYKKKSKCSVLTKTKKVTSPETVLKFLLFECDYCKKVFNRKHSLVRHIYLHLGRNPYSCPVCPKKYRILKNMKNHVDRDHCVKSVDVNAQSYSCNICDKPFLSNESLELHLTCHAKGKNSFKCIYCDKKFNYQLLLVQHEKKHLVTGKYQCTLCDVKYNSRDKLYVHVKAHLKLTDYICQYCGREFLRANSMKRHIQTMHGGRTIQCPICNKKLKGHLSEHLRTHDKARPHKCPDCGKLFAQSTQMKVHRRGHTGYRPYTCRICERPFSHSNALMLHLRRHTGEKPFPCAECPMSFSQLPHMKAHMSKIHGKQNPYKCTKCADYFKLKKDLIFHKKSCKGTGVDTDLYGDRKNNEESLQDDDTEVVPVESTMSLSRMRFLLALLLTMIASKEKLKCLGFNKRLIDDMLVDSLEAMDQTPCKDEDMSPLIRLRTNIETLLKGTVPSEQMDKFRKENKSTEELLELLTSEKEK